MQEESGDKRKKYCDTGESKRKRGWGEKDGEKNTSNTPDNL